MIQFNLLPDVKLDYIKAQRTKRIVVLSSLIATTASLLLLVVLFAYVQKAQKDHINDITKDITTQSNKLKDTKDLNKILTIQNQLNSLPDLHKNKAVASRVFTYMQQVTPVQANIASLNIDFDLYSIKLVGTADSFATINKFSDTLKFATFKNSKSDNGKPFTDVVTTLTASDKNSSYTISFNYDKALFFSDETPTLVVPNIISTRSETEKPASVFKEQIIPAKTGGN